MGHGPLFPLALLGKKALSLNYQFLLDSLLREGSLCLFDEWVGWHKMFSSPAGIVEFIVKPHQEREQSMEDRQKYGYRS